MLAKQYRFAEADAGGNDDNDQPAVTTTTTTAPPETTAALPEITLPPRPPEDYAGFVAQPTACGGEAPAEVTPMTFSGAEDQALDTGQKVLATIATSCGDITIELDPSLAPETVNSFVFLAREGFFDGTIIHRLVPEFVLQGGDPDATGQGGPGYTVQDEFPDSDFVYEPGTVAVARSALANSGGSQFFIVTGEQGEVLAPQFSVIGRVTDGFDVIDVVKEIEVGGPSTEGSTPQETIYIESVTVTP